MVSGVDDTCRRSEDAVAFALHALEPDEEAALREHLAGCASCRATVADTELTAAALAAAVEQVDPPARLRGNILAQAARTPQTGRDPTPDATYSTGYRRPAGQDVAGARPPTDPARSATRSGGGSGPRRSQAGAEPQRGRGTSGPGRRRRRLVVAALALVAVVAVAGVGGLAAYTVQLQQQRDAQIAQSQALADVLTQVDRPGTSHATLSTSDGRPVGAVVAGTSARTVVTAGLPANDAATSIYVLWGVSTDAAPEPIGTFDVADGAPGPGVHQLGPAAGEQPFIGYAVSLEPGRVAPAAPTIVVASGQVQS
ncbi:putative zinc finger protein [Pseudonocardia cypriaca]|uniref:Regulator of SigK n=1 Tax=Pseudonocardia cypriaca TaxID=882449 RepID=A0A543FS99_9PSEU|nr:putative zinc finger protein [Pseudonocardia cypriaca]